MFIRLKVMTNPTEDRAVVVEEMNLNINQITSFGTAGERNYIMANDQVAYVKETPRKIRSLIAAATAGVDAKEEAEA